jgi:hypothetical protein
MATTDGALVGEALGIDRKVVQAANEALHDF